MTWKKLPRSTAYESWAPQLRKDYQEDWAQDSRSCAKKLYTWLPVYGPDLKSRPRLWSQEQLLDLEHPNAWGLLSGLGGRLLWLSLIHI